MPTEDDPRFARAAIDQCLLERRRELPAEVGDPDELAEGPSLQDQRGTAGALVMWFGATYELTCLVTPTGTGGFETQPGFVAGGARPPDSLFVTSYVRVHGGDSEIEGFVDPDATRVEIVTEAGTVIEATHGFGRFIAWWPLDEDAVTVVARDSEGSILAELSADAEGRFPFEPDE